MTAAAQARYRKSPKGKETERRYNTGTAHREAHHRWNVSPKGREWYRSRDHDRRSKNGR